MPLEKDSHSWRLLAYLYERQEEWVRPSDLYGKDKQFPKTFNSVPSKLAKQGLVEKVKDDNKHTKIQITPKGIAYFEEQLRYYNCLAVLPTKPETIPIKNAIERAVNVEQPLPIPDFSPFDLYNIKTELGNIEKDVLKFLFYEKAFISNSARSIKEINEKTNIAIPILTEHIEKLITKQLIIKTISNSYYLTSNGHKIAEALVLKGLEFTDDSLSALILNPIGRKVIHLIEAGKTAHSIAEDIGYQVEELFFEDNYQLHTEMNYAIHKVYQILDRFRKFGLIELRYHPNMEGSAKITRINKRMVIEILQGIAIMVEFIPTLLIEDTECESILRLLVSSNWLQRQLMRFNDITQIPKQLRGKVANAERIAYWLEPIEALEKDAMQWEYIDLKINGNKHYFMVSKNKPVKKK